MRRLLLATASAVALAAPAMAQTSVPPPGANSAFIEQTMSNGAVAEQEQAGVRPNAVRDSRLRITQTDAPGARANQQQLGTAGARATTTQTGAANLAITRQAPGNDRTRMATITQSQTSGAAAAPPMNAAVSFDGVTMPAGVNNAFARQDNAGGGAAITQTQSFLPTGMAGGINTVLAVQTDSTGGSITQAQAGAALIAEAFVTGQSNVTQNQVGTELTAEAFVTNNSLAISNVTQSQTGMLNRATATQTNAAGNITQTQSGMGNVATATQVGMGQGAAPIGRITQMQAGTGGTATAMQTNSDGSIEQT